MRPAIIVICSQRTGLEQETNAYVHSLAVFIALTDETSKIKLAQSNNINVQTKNAAQDICTKSHGNVLVDIIEEKDENESFISMKLSETSFRIVQNIKRGAEQALKTAKKTEKSGSKTVWGSLHITRAAFVQGGSFKLLWTLSRHI